MRRSRERVLLLAGGCDCTLVTRFGEPAHGLVGEDVVQAVVGEVILHRHTAVLESRTRFLEHVRCLGHRFLTTGDDDLEFPRPDQLIVNAGTSIGIPTTTAACRAGADPHGP